MLTTTQFGIRARLAAAAFAVLVAPAAMAQDGPIKIGLLAPMTGVLATSGQDMANGFKLSWEKAGYKAGGRDVEVIVANTECNPDNALTQARRLALQDEVDVMVGPLCGHEGPAAAQVSKETGVPLVMDPAGADAVTKWDRTPTVVRTSVSSSQIGHPFGDYLYNVAGLRHVTFVAQDYTFGQEVALGAMRTFEEAGGKIDKVIWNPIATSDYGPTISAIPPDTEAVAVVLVGANRVRMFEAWFDFGMDRKMPIYGNYWLQSDVLPQMDDRAVGLIGNCLIYASGLETPEHKAFFDAFAKAHGKVPSWFAESAYTAALWVKTAIDSIDGKVEDREVFLKAMRTVKVTAPRGPVQLDAYDNPIQNVYVTEIKKVNHPDLGEVMLNVPVKTYEAVSQFWTYKPEDFLARGPYKR
jgi:branched-chain amino acid transport system substrate-binding protein